VKKENLTQKQLKGGLGSSHPLKKS